MIKYQQPPKNSHQLFTVAHTQSIGLFFFCFFMLQNEALQFASHSHPKKDLERETLQTNHPCFFLLLFKQESAPPDPDQELQQNSDQHRRCPQKQQLIQLSPLLSSYHSKRTEVVMITKTRLVHIFVLVLAFMSVFRLMRLAITTFPYSPVPSLFPPLLKGCGLACDNSSHSDAPISGPTSTLTIKEVQFLKDLISHTAPCNLLIFGLEPEYLLLSEINSQGTTIMLDDNPHKLRFSGIPSYNTSIHKVEYPIPAKDAYKVLKQVRKKGSCLPQSGPLKASQCRLALTALPEEVYRQRWDVIIVDGPSSDRPGAPGRMPVIYSASMLARAGNRTNVVVHDVDRVIEKWFSWEFLCENNLVSTKGKFWNFLLEGGSGSPSNSTSFC